MESIQCKQVRAHILFSLTALVLDHADIQLLRDLLLSLQTLQKGPHCSQFSHPRPPSNFLKLHLKVQWVNTVPVPPLSHPPCPGDVT